MPDKRIPDILDFTAPNNGQGLRLGGRIYQPGEPVPARYGMQSEPVARPYDPGNAHQALAPNVGRTAIPHISTFSGIVSTLARTYRNHDEAMRHCKQNARAMLHDPQIVAPLLARQTATALLNWSIEAEDAKDPKLKAVADELTKILQATHRFTEYRRWLLEAIWYGRCAVMNQYSYNRDMHGNRRWKITGWTPISGDKLQFRYDDGTGRYDPNQVGVLVSPAHVRKDIWAGKPYIEWNAEGSAVFFNRWERSRISIHKHMIRDGEYEDPLTGGMIHGVGLRHLLYWTWYQKQETLAQLAEVVERTGMGFTVYYYPSGNDKARAEVAEIAKNQASDNQIIMPYDAASPDSYRVEQIPPNTGGIAALQTLVDDYFADWIIRTILGQTLSMRSSATGLGSGVADLHQDSFMQVVRYDAVNLEETITYEVLKNLKDFNFPKYRNVEFYFRLQTESKDLESRLPALMQAWQMGAELKTSDIMDLLGTSMPQEGDDTLVNPEMQMAKLNLEMAQQQMLAQAQGTGPMPPQGPQQPPGEAPPEEMANEGGAKFGPSLGGGVVESLAGHNNVNGPYEYSLSEDEPDFSWSHSHGRETPERYAEGQETSPTPGMNTLKHQGAGDLSRSYIEKYPDLGLSPDPIAPVKGLDHARSQKIADWYESTPDMVHDPETMSAYQALADETKQQFQHMLDHGYQVQVMRGNDEPYATSHDMIDDLNKNRRMKVFATEDNFGQGSANAHHPLLQQSGFKDANGYPLLVNDVFRAIHDFYGHAEHGNQFGPIGEETAWLNHSRMFSPQARRAMTAETRGQNSWVNFGKHIRRPDGTIPKKGDPDWIHPSKRPFAEQKSLLAPEEFLQTYSKDRYDAQPDENADVDVLPPPESSIDEPPQPGSAGAYPVPEIQDDTENSTSPLIIKDQPHGQPKYVPPEQTPGGRVKEDLDLFYPEADEPVDTKITEHQARAIQSVINGEFEHIGAEDFHRLMKSAPGGVTLTQYSPEQLSSDNISLHKLPGYDVSWGLKYYIDEEGNDQVDLIGVLNADSRTPGVAMAAAVLHAIENGVTTLDAFNVIPQGSSSGILGDMYSSYGFVPSWSVQFDPNYKEPGQDVGEYETPEGQERLRQMEQFWQSQGWVPERDESGQITNYPIIQGMKFSGDENDRRRARETYLRTGAVFPRGVEGAGDGWRDAYSRRDRELAPQGGGDDAGRGNTSAPDPQSVSQKADSGLFSTRPPRRIRPIARGIVAKLGELYRMPDEQLRQLGVNPKDIRKFKPLYDDLMSEPTVKPGSKEERLQRLWDEVGAKVKVGLESAKFLQSAGYDFDNKSRTMSARQVGREARRRLVLDENAAIPDDIYNPKNEYRIEAVDKVASKLKKKGVEVPEPPFKGVASDDDIISMVLRGLYGKYWYEESNIDIMKQIDDPDTNRVMSLVASQGDLAPRENIINTVKHLVREKEGAYGMDPEDYAEKIDKLINRYKIFKSDGSKATNAEGTAEGLRGEMISSTKLGDFHHALLNDVAYMPSDMWVMRSVAGVDPNKGVGKNVYDYSNGRMRHVARKLGVGPNGDRTIQAAAWVGYKQMMADWIDQVKSLGIENGLSGSKEMAGLESALGRIREGGTYGYWMNELGLKDEQTGKFKFPELPMISLAAKNTDKFEDLIDAGAFEWMVKPGTKQKEDGTYPEKAQKPKVNGELVYEYAKKHPEFAEDMHTLLMAMMPTSNPAGEGEPLWKQSANRPLGNGGQQIAYYAALAYENKELVPIKFSTETKTWGWPSFPGIKAWNQIPEVKDRNAKAPIEYAARGPQVIHFGDKHIPHYFDIGHEDGRPWQLHGGEVHVGKRGETHPMAFGDSQNDAMLKGHYDSRSKVLSVAPANRVSRAKVTPQLIGMLKRRFPKVQQIRAWGLGDHEPDAIKIPLPDGTVPQVWSPNDYAKDASNESEKYGRFDENPLSHDQLAGMDAVFYPSYEMHHYLGIGHAKGGGKHGDLWHMPAEGGTLGNVAVYPNSTSKVQKSHAQAFGDRITGIFGRYDPEKKTLTVNAKNLGGNRTVPNWVVGRLKEKFPDAQQIRVWSNSHKPTEGRHQIPFPSSEPVTYSQEGITEDEQGLGKPEGANAPQPSLEQSRNKWYEGSQVGMDEYDPETPMKWHHGTTRSFEEFDPGTIRHGNDFGAGVYFTTAEDDAAYNYGDINSPDSTNRVEQTIDQLSYDFDPGNLDDDDLAKAHAFHLNMGNDQGWPESVDEFIDLVRSGDFEDDDGDLLRAYANSLHFGDDPQSISGHLKLKNPMHIDQPWSDNDKTRIDLMPEPNTDLINEHMDSLFKEAMDTIEIEAEDGGVLHGDDARIQNLKFAIERDRQEMDGDPERYYEQLQAMLADEGVETNYVDDAYQQWEYDRDSILYDNLSPTLEAAREAADELGFDGTAVVQEMMQDFGDNVTAGQLDAWRRGNSLFEDGEYDDNGEMYSSSDWFNAFARKLGYDGFIVHHPHKLYPGFGSYVGAPIHPGTKHAVAFYPEQFKTTVDRHKGDYTHPTKFDYQENPDD